MRLKDKKALVTGGGRGIGAAIAIAFAQEGADVLVTAKSNDELNELEETVSKIEASGRKGIAIPIDLTKREAIASFVETVFSHMSAIDILVNNAGMGSGKIGPKMIVDFDDDLWDTMLFLHLTAPYLLTKAFLPGMIKAGWGRIINIASVAGKTGMPTGAAYSASKHGLISLTRTSALEAGPTGVTINAICPGFVRTKMAEKRWGISAEMSGKSVEDLIKASTPIQRGLEPDEIAEMAVFLASNSAKGITGQAYNVDGGMLMS